MAASDKQLINALDQLNKNIESSNRQSGFWYSFLRSIVTALGATVGVTIVLTVGLWILNQLSFIPGVTAITQAVQQFDSQHSGK